MVWASLFTTTPPSETAWPLVTVRFSISAVMSTIICALVSPSVSPGFCSETSALIRLSLGAGVAWADARSAALPRTMGAAAKNGVGPFWFLLFSLSHLDFFYSGSLVFASASNARAWSASAARTKT